MAALQRPSLDGPRAKIERAQEHLHALDAATAEFFDTEPYEVIGEFDSDTSQYVWTVWVARYPPLRLGTILGDFAHNLRSALDLLVWQLVKLNGGGPTRDNEFVIARSQADFDRRARTRLAGVSSEHRALLEGIQPYHAGARGKDHFLILLAWLSNTDKHQIVHPTYGYFRPDPPLGLTFLPNRAAGEVGRQWVPKNKRVTDGAQLVRVELSPVGPNPEVKMYGNLTLDIAFGDRPLRANALGEIGSLVHELVEAFADAFSP